MVIVEEARRADGHSSLTTAVELYWIPLGAGGHSVRFNGKVYEAITAAVARRPRRDIYHSALTIQAPGGLFTVEMTPVPDARGSQRGVVAEGPVGARWAGRLRIFRYEVRCWRDGVIPDLASAVHPPILVSQDARVAARILEILPTVPALTWGRDERHAGEMWSCNSIISWTLTGAGVDTAAIALPDGGRAPGWDAGIAVARNGCPMRTASAGEPSQPAWASSRVASTASPRATPPSTSSGRWAPT